MPVDARARALPLLRAGSLLAVLLFGACAPPPAPDADAVATSPSIRITWPPPETPVTGCDIVSVEVLNFELVEFPTTQIVEGEGHYHIFHPGGYSACYKPWCLVDFSGVTETTAPYFEAVLAQSNHDDLLDENGDTVSDRIPIEFVPGPCAITGGDDTDEYDTGGSDTGASDTGGSDTGAGGAGDSGGAR